VFKDARLEDEGKKVISSAKKEVVRLNNEGVRLVEEGRLTEAIEHFERAAAVLSGNKIVNANAAQALMMYLEKNGREERYLSLAGQYLERVRSIDPSYKRYQTLWNQYTRITAQGKSS
jgi:tetratricopeptide (TPR) repeat protein